MKPSIWHRLDVLARELSPFALTFLLLLINAIPFHLPGFAQVAPLLPLIGIYFWAVYRPDLMPSWAVFFIGLIHDFLAGLPVGVSALVFLLVQAAAIAQRDFFFGKSFVIVWLGFGIVAAGALSIEWVSLSALSGVLVDAQSAFYQYAITVALFPFLAWLFTRWRHAFLMVD